MPIRFRCTNCEKQLRVKDDLAGKSLRCPSCKKRLKVPIESELSPEDEPADGAETEKAARESAAAREPSAQPGDSPAKKAKATGVGNARDTFLVVGLVAPALLTLALSRLFAMSQWPNDPLYRFLLFFAPSLAVILLFPVVLIGAQILITRPIVITLGKKVGETSYTRPFERGLSSGTERVTTTRYETRKGHNWDPNYVDKLSYLREKGAMPMFLSALVGTVPAYFWYVWSELYPDQNGAWMWALLLVLFSVLVSWLPGYVGWLVLFVVTDTICKARGIEATGYPPDWAVQCYEQGYTERLGETLDSPRAWYEEMLS